MQDSAHNSLPIDEALRRIEAALQPVCGLEKLSIRDALGRILAEDINSTINVPHHTNSAMDGYALAARDIPSSGTRGLAVIGTAWAGRPFAHEVKPGECVRIMTGAKMPAGTDTVVMQERVRAAGDVLPIDTAIEPGANVRQAGEDLAIGQQVLAAGTPLNPAELGLLASLGTPEVSVHRRPRVAFFSTGDELRSPGEPLQEGQIYDSNRYTLYGMLSRVGVERLDMGVISDRREAIEQAFTDAAAQADVIITTGGVSVGAADYVTETLQKLGKVDFWKIAMKPGRPLTFGTVQGAVFFGLPGNPVSAMVTFYQFVQPALYKLMGRTDAPTLRVRVPCVTRLSKARGRTELQRGVLHFDSRGRLVVRSTGDQGSGILSSMSKANCFIILPMESSGVDAETLVDVQPFEGLI
jgi:molybdopterin molybdotransferase